jgi:transcriptional repressor NrdR
MQCPYCKSIKNAVVDSRLTDNNSAIRRRRQCEDCDNRFTTFERLRAANLIVEKKNQTREGYDREKLERGIWRAFEKRPIQHRQIDTMLNRLEEQWTQDQEVSTSRIGHDVTEALRDVDPIAYIRFASVYREFSDVKSFEDLIEKLG